MNRILSSVLAEVARVDGIRGLDLDTVYGTGGQRWRIMRDGAQEEYDDCARAGVPTFALALREELYEALAEADPTPLRAELVQVGAVVVRWIRAIDRATLPDMTCEPTPILKLRDAACDALVAAGYGKDAADLRETPSDLDGILSDLTGDPILVRDEKHRSALIACCALYAALYSAPVLDLPSDPPPPPPERWPEQ